MPGVVDGAATAAAMSAKARKPTKNELRRAKKKADKQTVSADLGIWHTLQAI